VSASEVAFKPVADEGDDMAGDILIGADAIAEYLYGDGKLRRRVYHLVETSRFPAFRLGSVICARRSVLRKWISDQETRGVTAK
jgi:hypothetical protein